MFIGIDWGGTYIKAGLVDRKGTVLKRRVYASEKLKNKDVFVNAIGDLIRSFRARTITAVGIGAPGIIDIKEGFIYYLPNISGWEQYPLKRILEKKLSLPIYIDNDANVFALAEARLGNAKGAHSAIFLTLGTGLGGAIIYGEKILESRTSASEIGHVPVKIDGIQCGCGGKGCIETLVGSRYLLQRYQKLKKEKNPPREVRDIYLRARAGEREALLVWREFSHALGMFLSGMVNVFNPERIIFGGGVSGAFPLFKPMVWDVIKKQAMWPHLKNLKLLKAKLKDPGIIGAALLAKESLARDGEYIVVRMSSRRHGERIGL